MSSVKNMTILAAMRLILKCQMSRAFPVASQSRGPNNSER